MQRGHIIAQYNNVFDIADISGDRKGRQDCLNTRYMVSEEIAKYCYKAEMCMPIVSDNP
jgi:hypothetical protein